METIGQAVARGFKRQYYKKGKWDFMEGFEIQPQFLYLILRQLRSKVLIDALMGNDSWTRRVVRLKKKKKTERVR